ncbi:CynX/NimT family MFS transporter [Salinicoccus jeotgali]|uniref:CynX/NimT family MFS transporter n=1 Tax=Salinicoccus jeotgali TaxID=381634 RepID=A0ABP7E6A1_9STAP
MDRNGRSYGSKFGSKRNWLLVIGIILVGANLRGPLTSVGVLIPFIREDLAISNAVAGAITTLPLLAFALLSPIAPKIANRIGMERTVALSLVILIAGIAVRSISGINFLFLGTFFIGLAISVGNVLIPGIIKVKFPYKIGLMMGIYAIFMNVFGALGSGVSAPLASMGNFGWQGSLGMWLILAAVSLLVWLPQLKEKEDRQAGVKKDKDSSLLRSPLAWKITIFMGSQSLIFYTLVTWLPDILQQNGYDSNAAGWMVFLMQFAIIPVTFVVPVVAEKMKNQVALSFMTGALFITGLAGLLQGSALLVPLWAILIGVAAGSAFSLSMMFFTLRTKDGKEAATLSGMAQSFGYLLAAVGPVLVGALHDITGGWTLPLTLLIALAVIILIVGTASGKKGQVTA